MGGRCFTVQKTIWREFDIRQYQIHLSIAMARKRTFEKREKNENKAIKT